MAGCLECFACQVDLKRQTTTDEFAGQPAENHSGVGYGRFSAATAIANRTGIGAGTLRPNFERPVGINPSQGATPRADRHHIEHRGFDQIIFDVVERRQLRGQVAHQ